MCEPLQRQSRDAPSVRWPVSETHPAQTPTAGERSSWEAKPEKEKGALLPPALRACKVALACKSEAGSEPQDEPRRHLASAGRGDEGSNREEAGEQVSTGPHYLEGRLGNEAVEITNRGGDIHRNSPLLLRQGFGGLWRGFSCGCFLEKPGVEVIKIQSESPLLPPLHKDAPVFLLDPTKPATPPLRPLLSCLNCPEPPTFNTRSSKLLARAREALQGAAETVSPLGIPGWPTASLSSS